MCVDKIDILEYLMTWKKSTDMTSAAEALDVGCLQRKENQQPHQTPCILVPGAHVYQLPMRMYVFKCLEVPRLKADEHAMTPWKGLLVKHFSICRFSVIKVTEIHGLWLASNDPCLQLLDRPYWRQTAVCYWPESR